MILTIAKHEFIKSFKTGKILQLLALTQCVLGLIFYWLTEEYLLKSQQQLFEYTEHIDITEAIIHPLFAWTALLFFFLTPVFSAHTLTYERKTRTLELWLASPIMARTIILGKFLGIFLQQLVLALPMIIMPLWIVGPALDIGQFVSGLLGVIFLIASNLSIGFFIASLSKEPFIAIFASTISLFMLSLLEWINQVTGSSWQWVKEFALLYHCKNFLSGVISIQDIIYYGLLCAGFLYFSIARLNREAYFKKRYG